MASKRLAFSSIRGALISQVFRSNSITTWRGFRSQYHKFLPGKHLILLGITSLELLFGALDKPGFGFFKRNKQNHPFRLCLSVDARDVSRESAGGSDALPHVYERDYVVLPVGLTVHAHADGVHHECGYVRA